MLIEDDHELLVPFDAKTVKLSDSVTDHCGV